MKKEKTNFENLDLTVRWDTRWGCFCYMLDNYFPQKKRFLKKDMYRWIAYGCIFFAGYELYKQEIANGFFAFVITSGVAAILLWDESTAPRLHYALYLIGIGISREDVYKKTKEKLDEYHQSLEYLEGHEHLLGKEKEKRERREELFQRVSLYVDHLALRLSEEKKYN